MHRLVPALVLQRLLGEHGHLEFGEAIHLGGDADCIVVERLVFQMERLSVGGLGRDDQALAVLAVLHIDILLRLVLLFGLFGVNRGGGGVGRVEE